MDDRKLELELSLLKNRAERLAVPVEASEHNLEQEKLLVFNTMESRFAVPLAQVEAVTRIADIIPIPHTPPHIQGVIRRRGQTIALVNLRFFFNPDAEALVDEDYAVVVQAKGKLFALQVEDVEGVAVELKSEIFVPPESYDQKLRPYLLGITITEDTAILNLDAVVTTPNFGTTPIEG